MPTVPMIMNIETFRPGDEVSWIVGKSRGLSPRAMVKRMLSGAKASAGSRISLVITQEFIDKCRRARDLAKKCQKIPDLGEFLPQWKPEAVVDSGKYLIELRAHPRA